MHDPQEPHLTAMKCILCYLWDSLDFGLLLRHSATSELVLYIVADSEDCLDTHQSTSRYIVFLGHNLLS
jgi:hypothetical protein